MQFLGVAERVFFAGLRGSRSKEKKIAELEFNANNSFNLQEVNSDLVASEDLGVALTPES